MLFAESMTHLKAWQREVSLIVPVKVCVLVVSPMRGVYSECCGNSHPFDRLCISYSDDTDLTVLVTARRCKRVIVAGRFFLYECVCFTEFGCPFVHYTRFVVVSDIPAVVLRLVNF
jgi:hypothetical protein